MNEYKDGATYFVTLECFHHQPLLARPRLKQLLLNAIQETKKQFGLHLGGYVILDDHAHLVFVAANADSEHLGPMTYLRARFVRAWRELEKDVNDATFWEHGIKARVLADHDDLRAHLDYIHYDPVKHGLCERAYDYLWSSLRIRVDQGIYTEDWAELGPPASLGRFAPHG
ncbi:MAG: transposase [Gammaproteobacteria bacterium]|nr:transposase [Gammaproteobacteria bacterium]